MKELERDEKFERDLKILLDKYHCYLTIRIDEICKCNSQHTSAELIANFMTKLDRFEYEASLEKIQVE